MNFMTDAETALSGDPGEPLSKLCELVETLRGENGCPWDRVQTAETMRVYLIEEAFELLEALDHGAPDDVCEELGDVLFQVFFLASLFREKGLFGMADVARRNAAKMIRRHPHVFGDEKAESAEDVRRRWFELKNARHADKTPHQVVSKVPRGLPALLRAYRVCERAHRVGVSPFPEENLLDGVKNRLSGLLAASATGDKNAVSGALGDLLLNLAAASFSMGTHPDTALSGALDRFIEKLEIAERPEKE